MFQLCQLNLQLAFMAAGPQGKDDQDQAGAIKDPTPEAVLQVAFLGTAQCAIEQRDVDLFGGDTLCKGFNLSRSNQKLGGRHWPSDLGFDRGCKPRCANQFAELQGI